MLPETDNSRLLLSFIPCRRKQDERRLTCSFKCAHEATENDQTGEVVHGCDQGNTDAPEEDIEGEPFGDGYALDDPIFLSTYEHSSFILSVGTRTGYSTQRMTMYTIVVNHEYYTMSASVK